MPAMFALDRGLHLRGLTPLDPLSSAGVRQRHFERESELTTLYNCVIRRPSDAPCRLTACRYSLQSLVEPWLSSCRAVEASVEPLSRPLSRPCLSSLVEPVEFLSSLSRLTPCAWASSSCRAVEFLSSFLSRLSSGRRVSGVLSSSSLACSFAILHEAL